MRRLPSLRRAVMAATACSAAVLPVVLTPSPAWAEAPNPSACRSLYHGDPPGSLAITSTPSSGTVLHPGDEVEVTATWNTADWPKPRLHKVLHCVLVNGQVDYELSSQEKPTDNDGLYRYRFTVRHNARGRICDRVRLSGRLVDDGPHAVQKSNTICFAVAAAGATGTVGGPAGVTTHAATPADEGRPAPLQSAGLVPEPPTPVAEPGPPPLPAVELSSIANPTLPRTGADALPLARLGALLVVLGVAVTLGSLRLRRAPRPADLV